MVEGGGLLSRRARKGSAGSNPALSAMHQRWSDIMNSVVLADLKSVLTELCQAVAVARPDAVAAMSWFSRNRPAPSGVDR